MFYVSSCWASKNEGANQEHMASFQTCPFMNPVCVSRISLFHETTSSTIKVWCSLVHLRIWCLWHWSMNTRSLIGRVISKWKLYPCIPALPICGSVLTYAWFKLLHLMLYEQSRPFRQAFNVSSWYSSLKIKAILFWGGGRSKLLLWRMDIILVLFLYYWVQWRIRLLILLQILYATYHLRSMLDLSLSIVWRKILSFKEGMMLMFMSHLTIKQFIKVFW